MQSTGMRGCQPKELTGPHSRDCLGTAAGETQTGGYIFHQWISIQIAGEDEQDSVHFRCVEWSLCFHGHC